MDDAPRGTGGDTVNSIVGGILVGTVIQGRDITVHLPPRIPTAAAGLPEPPPTFTGREDEVEALLAALEPRERGVSVSAVAGMPGVGKTAVVLHVARHALDAGWFTGGVLFVDMFGYDEERRLAPEAALRGFLHALAVPDDHLPTGVQDLTRLYTSILDAYAREGRRILVVVDNAASADQARPLLPTGNAHAALVTSRHTLAGLGARLHDLSTLETDVSVDLLRRALRHARGPEDTRIDESPDDAAAIARLCGNLPLALQVVAALLSDNLKRPLADTVAELGATRAGLTAFEREEQAVRAAFALSHRNLTEEQARLFRLFSLNNGPDLSTEAAAELLDADLHQARLLLESLARAHLLEPGSVYGRWRMHDLVRVYAYEHARVRDRLQEVLGALERLWRYYDRMARSACRHLDVADGDVASPDFPGRREALTWLRRERENVLGAIAFAAAIGHPDSTVILTAAITPFLNHGRHFEEALAAATVTLRMVLPKEDPGTEAWARSYVGHAHLELRQHGPAAAQYERAAALYRDLGDTEGEARSLDHLGMALRELDGRLEESVAAHERALSLSRRISDRHGEAKSTNHLGLALQRSERFHDAVALHRRAHALFAELGDETARRVAANSLADAQQGLRAFEDAAATYTENIAHYRRTGQSEREAGTLEHFGIALVRLGRFAEAAAAHRRSATLWEELADDVRQAIALVRFAEALAEGGERLPEDALDAYRTAADLYRRAGHHDAEGRALNRLGTELSETGRTDDAIVVNTRAAEVWRHLGEPVGEGLTLELLAIDLAQEGRLTEAAAAARRSAEAWAEAGDLPARARVLHALGNVLVRAAKPDVSIGPFRTAIGIFREAGDRAREANASNMLAFALQATGRVDEAVTVLERAAALFRDLGDREGQAQVARNLEALAREHPVPGAGRGAAD
ncbi:ATP-binding protein [Saccharothrix saharensis]|uniref:ATP-binding protein n=1 Tax=Saccharothrix saharensis TaxID=571190 RepID=UPI00369FDA58